MSVFNMKNMQNGFMNKFANRMFRKADGIVWDLMTGNVGVVTDDGIATISGSGEYAQVVTNLFDQMSMEVPAFAQSTPVADVQIGDLIYFGANNDKPGWVVGKTEKKPKAGQPGEPFIQLQLMRTNGTVGNWNPPKTQMVGFGDSGVMVIRTLTNMLPGGQGDLNNMQNGIMQMMQMQMMMGGESEMDLESIMPMMLMGGMSGNAGGGNMMQMMMQMQMMKSMFGAKSQGPSSAAIQSPFRKG